MDFLKGFKEKAQQNLEFLNQAGMAVSIVKDDKVVFAGGFGFKDVEQRKKADENTIFPIGSASKAFTSTAVMIAQDKGLLNIDKPLRDYLPELVFQSRTANESVTARDIMCHRTGLPRHDALWVLRPNISRREIVETVRLLQPSVPFRTKWQYNNLMFASSGYLVEKVSGKQWEDFTKENIFQPLKMTNANFSTEDSVINGNFALPYALDRKKGELDPVTFSRICASGPAGSINASALEMANWVRFNLGQGTFEGDEVLSKTNFTHLVNPNIPYVLYPWDEPEIRIMGYSLGWFVDSYRGKKMIWHGGNVNGASAVVAFIPEINAGVTVLVNTGGSMLTLATMYDIFDRMLGYGDAKDWAKVFGGAISKAMEQGEKAGEEFKKTRKAARTTHDLEDFAGTYVNEAYGTVKVGVSGKNLYVKMVEKKLRLENWHYDVFMLGIDDEFQPLQLDIAFITGVSGKIEAFQSTLESTPGVAPILFKKIEKEG